MREILFRGKRVDNGEWVEGGYYQPNDPECSEPNKECYIIITEDLGDVIGSNEIEVTLETVGQFTGLTDKNGTKIFEGDIVKFRGGKKPRNEERGFISSEVIFKGSMFTVKNNQSIVYDYAVLSISEIIGNIHDNPELI